MVKGRLPRESNPLPGDKSGFVASHDTTGEEDYKRTSPLNPLPVKSIGDGIVKDVAVKAELELIKQSIADNKATNDLILARLDNPIDTKLTGSNVEQDVKDVAVKSELELIKQGIADNKSTNDLILAKLDSGVNTQLTGSNVGYSTDDKSLIEADKSDTFLELDTGVVFIYDGTDWVDL